MTFSYLLETVVHWVWNLPPAPLPHCLACLSDAWLLTSVVLARFIVFVFYFVKFTYSFIHTVWWSFSIIWYKWTAFSSKSLTCEIFFPLSVQCYWFHFKANYPLTHFSLYHKVCYKKIAVVTVMQHQYIFKCHILLWHACFQHLLQASNIWSFFNASTDGCSTCNIQINNGEYTVRDNTNSTSASKTTETKA